MEKNKYFDRKSAKIKPSDIADLISAFANAEGGTIVLGISDRKIRFVRYDGNAEQVGVNINIIKDVNIEYPILRIIDKTKEFIITQLREFTSLDLNTGRFQNLSIRSFLG